MFIVGGPTIVGDEPGAIRKLTEKIDDISKRGIKVRDRVDISLEEYEQMKAEIRRLSIDNRYMTDILSQLRIPLDMRIIPGSIDVVYTHDIKDFRLKYRIEFEVEDI